MKFTFNFFVVVGLLLVFQACQSDAGNSGTAGKVSEAATIKCDCLKPMIPVFEQLKGDLTPEETEKVVSDNQAKYDEMMGCIGKITDLLDEKADRVAFDKEVEKLMAEVCPDVIASRPKN